MFDRILQNKPFDSRLKPYSKNNLKQLLSYLEQIEEYEKCHFLSLYIKERFNHNYNFIIKKKRV